MFTDWGLSSKEGDALSAFVKQQQWWCKVNENATMVNRNK